MAHCRGLRRGRVAQQAGRCGLMVQQRHGNYDGKSQACRRRATFFSWPLQKARRHAWSLPWRHTFHTFPMHVPHIETMSMRMPHRARVDWRLLNVTIVTETDCPAQSALDCAPPNCRWIGTACASLDTTSTAQLVCVRRQTDPALADATRPDCLTTSAFFGLGQVLRDIENAEDGQAG